MTAQAGANNPSRRTARRGPCSSGAPADASAAPTSASTRGSRRLRPSESKACGSRPAPHRQHPGSRHRSQHLRAHGADGSCMCQGGVDPSARHSRARCHHRSRTVGSDRHAGTAGRRHSSRRRNADHRSRPPRVTGTCRRIAAGTRQARTRSMRQRSRLATPSARWPLCPPSHSTWRRGRQGRHQRRASHRRSRRIVALP